MLRVTRNQWIFYFQIKDRKVLEEWTSGIIDVIWIKGLYCDSLTRIPLVTTAFNKVKKCLLLTCDNETFIMIQGFSEETRNN